MWEMRSRATGPHRQSSSRSTEIGYVPPSVLSFYPGFIDAETVLARFQDKLRSASLHGAPYDAVVIDGLHNVLLQYPLLEKERLLWPAMYRLLRKTGIETVSTFTFFELAQGKEKSVEMSAVSSASQPVIASDILMHLLVSSCDYSFLAERSRQRPLTSEDVQVTLVSSIDRVTAAPQQFYWNSARYRTSFRSSPSRR
jgi:hypothetical protein